MINIMLKWYELRRMAGKAGVCLLFAACILALSGCHPLQGTKTEKITRYEKNFEITGKEKDEMIGKVNPAIFTTADRSNEKAESRSEPTILKSGKKFSLPSGRYSLHGHPVGNVFIYDKDGELVLREIVGGAIGVNSLTVDIDETYTIFADGGYKTFDAVPSPTRFSNELTAGVWEVGLDIEAGDYTVGSPWGLGYLEIHEKGQEPVLYEIIGGDPIRSESNVQLKDGQKLRIKNLGVVNFEPTDSKSGK